MAIVEQLCEAIERDLGVNYNPEDGNVLRDLVEDVIEDALLLSNRDT